MTETLVHRGHLIDQKSISRIFQSCSKSHFSLLIFSVLAVSRLLAVSSTTWPCIRELRPSIVESVAKPLSLATNFCCIKNPGIQTNDLMLANGVAKDSCSPISWPNIDEEFILARNPSSVTCATNDSPIQGMSKSLLKASFKFCPIFDFILS